MRALTLALGGGDRIFVVTGECGVGKTTLLGVFREQIPPHWAVVHLDPCRADAAGLLPSLLHALGAPSRGHGAPDADFRSAAAWIQAGGTATALLIDEAQILKDDALAELAALVQRTSGLWLFLFGQPGLAVRLRQGGGRALATLPNRRHVLRPLDRADVQGYVRFRSTVDGRCGPEFTDAAIDLICIASRGSPRLVDRLCDTASALGGDGRKGTIDAEIVREAVRLSNGFDVFASSEALMSDAVAPGVSASGVEAPAMQRLTRTNQLRGPPSAALSRTAHALSSAPPRANAARARGAEGALRPRRPEVPKPDIRFVEETLPRSAVSSADLIVYEAPEPFFGSGEPEGEPQTVSPITGGSAPAPRHRSFLPDPDSLTTRRLLVLSSICLLLSAAGLFLQPFSALKFAGLAAYVATTEPADEAAAPQAAPVPPLRPDDADGGVLEDLIEHLPTWQGFSEPEEEPKPRLFGPSRKKRPLELGEVLELWRPHADPNR